MGTPGTIPVCGPACCIRLYHVYDINCKRVSIVNRSDPWAIVQEATMGRRFKLGGGGGGGGGSETRKAR